MHVNPDLYIKISGSKEDRFHSIEIKSTKQDTIPGSSVQQIVSNEWTIFIKHNSSQIDVACSLYRNCITDKLPFPDRSPRPQVGFNTMKKWNVLHRKVNRGMLQYKIDTEENLRKDKILLDWQHTLCEEWFDIISREKKPKEKWFNNVIRKYSLLLLEKIETSPKSIKDYISILRKNIID